ncbi:DUF397 domain-containing protein [Streptomyces sp. NPDC048258]|uniref:DUF397 domain-containing protein n=1 Tax=Streptomyces sp. NPDC048258 TaxID=3365527 RepID=UPI00371DE19B
MSSSDTGRPHGQWFKSSYSGGTSGECVEACPQPGTVYVRDSKRKDEPEQAVLGFSMTAWASFTGSIGREASA